MITPVRSRRSPLRLFLLSALQLSALSLSGSAQTAELSGIVRDPSDAAIPEAVVTGLNQNTLVERETKTNRLGYYTLPFLPAGNYRIRVQAAGFNTAEQRTVTLKVASNGRLDFVLRVAGSPEAITVKGDLLGTNRESPGVSTTIDQQFIAHLPISGRTFQSLITLVPGVVPTTGDGQFSVNGQRDDSNYFSVDGVGANAGISAFRSLEETAGGTVPALSILGTTQNLVSVDGMMEFRVQTANYSAEFGRTPGGQVQIITRSGTNDFHGGVFEYLRNEVLDANDWFANAHGLPKAPLRQNDFGATFGGPIVRNRAFLFLSYEGLRLRQPQFAQINVPSLSARTQAPTAIAQLLSAFPVPNGPEDPLTMIAQFSASYSDPASLNSGSIRFDQIVTNKLSLFGRFSEAQSSGMKRADSLSHVLINDGNTRFLTFGATYIARLALTNEFRGNYTRNESSHYNKLDDLGAAVPPPASLLFPAPFASPRSSRFIFFELTDGLRLVSGKSSDHVQRQLNFVDRLSILSSSHNLKFGGDYRNVTTLFGPQDYGQQVGFNTLFNAVNGKTPTVRIFTFDKLTLSFHNLSLYALDAWRPTPRLNLVYGMRWEFNPPPSNGLSLYTLSGLNDLATARAAPAGSPLFGTTYANFAPRVGLAYQISQHPRRETVLRGGLGVFYDLGSGAIGEAAESFPHFRQTTVTGVPFPLDGAAAPPPYPSLDPPYSAQTFVVFAPTISLPRTYQWSCAVEQSLGSVQAISASYVGSVGRKLLRRVSMVGSSPNFVNGSVIDLTTNTATSDYHALQLQFERRLYQGLQALVSYSWSHSIDIASSDVAAQIPSQYVSPELNRGSSDFDVRHLLQAAITYEIPGLQRRMVNAMFAGWSLAGIFVERTATPVDVTVNRFFGVDLVAARPDVVPGAPFYLRDATVAGGRRFNPGAFVVPVEQRQGTLGRNALRGFPLSQLDFSLGRSFHLTETTTLQIGADSFNVLNHPNFANPSGNLSSAKLFGVSTAMANTPFFGITNGLSPLFRAGGPRSFQISARFTF